MFKKLKDSEFFLDKKQDFDKLIFINGNKKKEFLVNEIKIDIKNEVEIKLSRVNVGLKMFILGKIIKEV